MAYEPQRIHEVNWAFSTKKQANYTTLVPDASLDQRVAMIGTDIGDLSKVTLSDAARFGKGHEFPTTRRELTRDLRLSRTLDLSSLMAGWASAFALGDVTSVQPNPGGNPSAWRHTIHFSAASSSRQPPVTTIYEELWGQTPVQRKLESVALDSFSISGRARDVAQLTLNFLGSGKITTGAVTLPSLTSVSLLDLGSAVFQIGPLGAPATLTERLLEFSVGIAQNLDADAGFEPGGGLFRKKVFFTTRRATFNATVEVDVANTDLYDNWLAEDLREVSFKLVGDQIGAGPETHDCEVKFPAVRLSAAQIGENTGRLVYRISAGEEDVYKGAGGTPDEPVEIVVTNTTSSYLAT